MACLEFGGKGTGFVFPGGWSHLFRTVTSQLESEQKGPIPRSCVKPYVSLITCRSHIVLGPANPHGKRRSLHADSK